MTTTLESLAAKWEAEAASSASIPTECTDDGAMYRACLEAKSETLTACAAELRAALAEGGWHKIVDEQAEDAGLWFIAQTAAEAYLQQELRRLHTAIEQEPPR